MLLVLQSIFSISITILYEKKVEKTVEQTYRIYLEQLLKSINTITKPKNINFEIDKIQSYSSYVNVDEYADLSGYAGEGDIKGRMLALEKMKVDNYIFAVTTNQYEEMEEYQNASPCKINYVFNLDSQENYDNDLLSNLQFALRDALSKVLKMDGMIPNLLNTQDKDAHESIEKYIDKLDDKKLFSSCNIIKENNKGEEDEDASLDRLEALLSKLKSKPDVKNSRKIATKEKKTTPEPKGETALILKSLQQMKDKIEQIDIRIKDVESGNSEFKPRKIHSRIRRVGSFENENVTPITLTNHDTNYQPFKFAKKEVKSLPLKEDKK